MDGERIKVAWVSRHPPLEAQLEVLREKLGDFQLVRIAKTFTSYKEVLDEIKRFGCQYAVIVLPLSMIAQLVQDKSITWLWAEMEGLHECLGPSHCSEYDSKRDVWLPLHGQPKGRHMRFKGFRRIVRVEMVTEPF
ncbi:MAG: hypothetical protein ACTSXX_02685 [Candidatus Baldrarchaeia archaeon]